MMLVKVNRPIWPLICPVCENPLEKVTNSLKCRHAHSYDISRNGYVNLLLSRGRAAKVRGDTKEMLRARRRFLESNQYARLSEAINQQVLDQLSRHQTPTTIVDVGCGEGYFIGQLQRELNHIYPGGEFLTFGVDVAKEATRLASKKYQRTRFVVADVRQKLPFAIASTQMILNVFAPRHAAEFNRISTPTGFLVVVIPGHDHLHELRASFELLRIERDKKAHIVAQLSNGFTLQDSSSVRYRMRVGQPLLVDLIQMTPNYWHMDSSRWSMMDEVTELAVTASFEILVFAKSPEPIE